nr:Xaa-Pro peptidase family protein [Candidatus Sigynarchaeum springense]
MEPIGYRKERVQAILHKYGIDVLVASTPANVFYTSGVPLLHVAPNPILYVLYNQFPTMSLVRSDGEEALAAWIIYQSARTQSWIKDVMGIASPLAAMKNIGDKIEQWGLASKVIGIESLMPRYQAEYLQKRFPGAKLVDGDPAFLEMRIVKTPEEIARIKKSTEITDKAIQAMIDALAIGMTDNDLLRVARRSIVDQGAEGWDHLTLGIGASDPEAPGVGTMVSRSDICRFDVGTVWQGYVSDISRNAVIGDVPAGADEVMDAMIQVQEFCVDNIKPGENTKVIGAKIKEFTKTAVKKGSAYVTVHSIGIECEEAQLLSPMRTADMPFQEGMVFDVEVWQPFKGAGLLGVEDCYHLTSDGCQRLSGLDKHIFKKK